MYPKQHAPVSAAATLLGAVFAGVPPVEITVWVVVGTVVGVFIDVDHVVIAVVLDRRVAEAKRWVKQPLRAVLTPEEFLADIDPEREMFRPRIVSHLLVLAAVLAVRPYTALAVPAAIGLSAHIAADILWDFWTRDGIPYL